MASLPPGNSRGRRQFHCKASGSPTICCAASKSASAVTASVRRPAYRLSRAPGQVSAGVASGLASNIRSTSCSRRSSGARTPQRSNQWRSTAFWRWRFQRLNTATSSPAHHRPAPESRCACCSSNAIASPQCRALRAAVRASDGQRSRSRGTTLCPQVVAVETRLRIEWDPRSIPAPQPAHAAAVWPLPMSSSGRTSYSRSKRHHGRHCRQASGTGASNQRQQHGPQAGHRRVVPSTAIHHGAAVPSEPRSGPGAQPPPLSRRARHAHGRHEPPARLPFPGQSGDRRPREARRGFLQVVVDMHCAKRKALRKFASGLPQAVQQRHRIKAAGQGDDATQHRSGFGHQPPQVQQQRLGFKGLRHCGPGSGFAVGKHAKPAIRRCRSASSCSVGSSASVSRWRISEALRSCAMVSGSRWCPAQRLPQHFVHQIQRPPADLP